MKGREGVAASVSVGGEENNLFKSATRAYVYEFTTKTDGLYAFCIKSTVDNAQTISVQLKVDAHLQPNADVVQITVTTYTLSIILD